MNEKKVMPEEIDNDLVNKIAWESAHLTGGWIEKYAMIRHVLAWLANHPLVITDAQYESCQKGWVDAGGNRQGDYWTYLLSNFQRIAYLHKEEELPEELKLIASSPPFGVDSNYWENTIIAVYKIGAKIK